MPPQRKHTLLPVFGRARSRCQEPVSYTHLDVYKRQAQIEESVARYLQQLDTADRQEPSEALKTKTSHLKEKIEKLKQQMQRSRFSR